MLIGAVRLLVVAAVVVHTRAVYQDMNDQNVRENASQDHHETFQSSDEDSNVGTRFFNPSRRMDQVFESRKRAVKSEDGKGKGKASSEGEKGSEKSKSIGGNSKAKSKKKSDIFMTPSVMPIIINTPSPMPSLHGSTQTNAPSIPFPPFASPSPSPTRSKTPSTTFPFPPAPQTQSLSPSAPQILLSNIPSMIPTICVGQDCSRPPRPI